MQNSLLLQNLINLETKKNNNDMKKDQTIFDIIAREKQRQMKGIELIASENFVSEQEIGRAHV